MITDSVFPSAPPPDGAIPEKEPLIGPSPNAFQHGCSSTGKVMTPGDKAKAERLYTMLCETHNPQTEYQKYLLQQLANALTLAERCQLISMTLIDESSLAAQSHWELQQSTYAEGLATKLPKNPGLIRSELEFIPQGIALLDDRWSRLGQALQSQGFWTDPQSSLALDLLGVPLEFREKGHTIIDPPPGEDPQKFLQAIVDQQLNSPRDPARMHTRQHFDEFRKDMAVLGAPVRITPEMRLMKRYEAMHIRRANQLLAEFEWVRANGEGEEPQPRPEPKTRFRGDFGWIFTKHQEEPRVTRREAAAAYGMRTAERLVPRTSASAPTAAPKPAAAPTSSNGSAPKPSANPQHPQRDRKAERERKKAERQARKKGRRQR